MAKSTSLKSPVSFSLWSVLLFTVIFGVVGGYAVWKTFAAPARYAPTLTVSPSLVHAGDSFNVSGCGFNPAYGNVIISFTGGSWGSRLDSNNCISISGIPALSGDTLPAGSYPVSAYQYVKANATKLTKVAQTTIAVQ